MYVWILDMSNYEPLGNPKRFEGKYAESGEQLSTAVPSGETQGNVGMFWIP